MSENAQKPRIRFKGFSDAWEQRKVGEVSESYSGGTPSVGVKEYYGGQIPFIRSAEINSEITELFLTEEGLKNSSARLVAVGDILYALYGATSGEVGRARLKGAINQAILAIKPHTDYDSEYLAQWLRKSKHSIIEIYLQGGQGNLSGTIVKELSVDFPSLKEQKAIGDFFRQLDNLITLHQRKYDKLVAVKKSLLEKMFPADGETVPKIRFKGFSDAWEQRKVGEVSESYSGGTPSVGVKEYYGGQIPFIRSAEINSEITELFLTEEGLKNSSARLVAVGDILYALYGATSGEVGRARLKGAINQAILAIKPHTDYDSEYLAQWLRKSKHSIIEIYLQGGQGNLSGTIVKELSVDFPSLKEQKAIGDFFRQLDNLITLHQRKLEKLKNIKSALLEKMFV